MPDGRGEKPLCRPPFVEVAAGLHHRSLQAHAPGLDRSTPPVPRRLQKEASSSCRGRLPACTGIKMLHSNKAGQVSKTETLVQKVLSWSVYDILKRNRPSIEPNGENKASGSEAAIVQFGLNQSQGNIAKEAKYGRSLFERLSEIGYYKHLLNVQYRMHPSISQFPNEKFYDKKIIDGPNVKEYHCTYLPGRTAFGSLDMKKFSGKDVKTRLCWFSARAHITIEEATEAGADEEATEVEADVIDGEDVKN
ncbi:hypothetical protein E2562_039238 [Oryza meyeriana var. granulata]|uniref:DNA2/NAM7 helicase-like C-terminal domain-containing protein n=1 Tax=Oryza meyeriana var. granulata TaxID=110450 RepID=A0A6G1CMD4_9ORYZ|nr:hypothetical protein E2562_039238 [Oryza meyeriana var. granulata]